MVINHTVIISVPLAWLLHECSLECTRKPHVLMMSPKARGCMITDSLLCEDVQSVQQRI